MTKGEESRQRLIKCAAELFWKNGYSATGISQILRQTGLPKLSARTTGRNFAGCPVCGDGHGNCTQQAEHHICIYGRTDMLPPLKSYRFSKWGLPARLPFRVKLKQAIPACPAVLFLSGYRFFLCAATHTFYISFFPSFRILTAAFTSRSIRFPHSHMYVRSDKASSFFLFPHTLHILLDAK